MTDEDVAGGHPFPLEIRSFRIKIIVNAVKIYAMNPV